MRVTVWRWILGAITNDSSAFFLIRSKSRASAALKSVETYTNPYTFCLVNWGFQRIVFLIENPSPEMLRLNRWSRPTQNPVPQGVRVRFPPPAPSKLAGSDKPPTRGVGACFSGSLGDARPALRFREMTIERYCHVGLRNPERDLAIATNCLF